MTRLHLGCGEMVVDGWINCDSSPSEARVHKVDLRRRLPFNDNSAEMIYASHVFEHLSPAEGEQFLRECHRVLKVGGLIRLAVPDLEEIARLYLRYLEEARQGRFIDRYQWMTIELLDQMARTAPAGRVPSFCASATPETLSFITDRIGKIDVQHLHRTLLHRISSFYKKAGLRGIIEKVIYKAKIRLCSMLIQRRLFPSLAEGIMRQSGEIHRWMYDDFSLMQILRQAGFVNPSRKLYNQSGYSDFANYHFEDISGTERKPDSLYVEGMKGMPHP